MQPRAVFLAGLWRDVLVIATVCDDSQLSSFQTDYRSFSPGQCAHCHTEIERCRNCSLISGLFGLGREGFYSSHTNKNQGIEFKILSVRELTAAVKHENIKLNVNSCLRLCLPS